MPGLIKLTTIECAVCSAWIEVFQQNEPEFILVWRGRDDEENICQHPPVTTCQQARAEVFRMYPDGVSIDP